MTGDKTLKGKEVVDHRTGNTMTGDKTLKGNEVVNHRTGNTMTGDKTLKGKLKIDQHKPHLQPKMNS
jgi:hypothetical protein